MDKTFQAMQNNPNPPHPYDNERDSISLPKDIEDELRVLVVKGRKVEAVKRVAQLTGAGLRISKDYVDDLAGQISF